MNTSIPEVAPKERVVGALEALGYHIIRQGSHIAMTYYTSSGIQLPMTIPDQVSYKSSTLRTILSRAGIAKQDFIQAYNRT
jgi:hypothetical protein